MLTLITFEVILRYNVDGGRKYRIHRSFKKEDEALKFANKIRPCCGVCVRRIECLASTHCLRLVVVRCGSNGGTKRIYLARVESK